MMAATAWATWTTWTTQAAALPLSAPPPGSERGEEFGKTSPIALVVILLLGLVTVLLIRSMTKRLRNVPASFDRSETSSTGRSDESDGPDDSPGETDGEGRYPADRRGAASSGNGTEGPSGAGSP